MQAFTLTSDVRVSTAGGEALFIDAQGATRGNDTGRGWLNLKAGTQIEVCASFPQTHTWMTLIKTVQVSEDGTVTESVKGAIFRKDSFDKLVAASQ